MSFTIVTFVIILVLWLPHVRRAGIPLRFNRNDGHNFKNGSTCKEGRRLKWAPSLPHKDSGKRLETSRTLRSRHSSVVSRHALLHQDHLVGHHMVTSLEAVEVNAAGQVTPIKGDRVIPGFHLTVNQNLHLLTQDVVDA